MIESSDRVEQFKAEIADMHIKDPAAGRDAQLLKGGAVVMLVGIVVTIVAYFAVPALPLTGLRRVRQRSSAVR